MDVASLVQAGALIFIAFATATAALLTAFLVLRRRSHPAPAGTPEVAFLFDGDVLVDATTAGRRLLGFANARGNDLARLIACLLPRFPDLADRLRACGHQDRILLLSSDGKDRLRIEAKGGTVRITLEDVDGGGEDLPDRHSVAVLSGELEAYRNATQGSPVALWQFDDDGRVVWAGGGYADLASRAVITEELEPGALPTLFPGAAKAGLPPGTSQRLQLQLSEEPAARWFDVSMQTVGKDRLYMAIPADAVVAAERNLREFIQTLTQTFAHLSVGLAIFDRKRELTLFNPALGDLLACEVEFLVARPSLMRFFDHLRERHMMPEPKDYKTWRQKMSELEAAASEGGHSETWPLPDGRTLRITGRPHPDGAVAFLFEDISAEISMSLEFRKELETGKAVLDTFDEAIAVFAPDGRLGYANRAYQALWFDAGALPSKRDRIPFLEASRHWQSLCRPSPVWGDAREFAAEMSGRTTWTAEVQMADGRRLACRFDPLPGGSTLVGFTILQDVAGGLSPQGVESVAVRSGEPSARA